MKKRIEQTLIAVGCVALLAAVMVGCVTRNPEHTTNPQAPVYIADNASISNAAFLAHTINNATAPLNLFAVPVNTVIDGSALIAAAVDGVFAKIKSTMANNEQAAAKVLAAVVHEASGGQAVRLEQCRLLQRTVFPMPWQDTWTTLPAQLNLWERLPRLSLQVRQPGLFVLQCLQALFLCASDKPRA